ncbi:MAG: IS4 family transposase [Prevotella denticola]|uniref:IS4 family transposase n=1 Tax=Prevotella denticola TaxID=28129 RepID=UPI003FA126E3
MRIFILDKKRGVDMVQLILSLILFRINGKTIGAMHKARFYDLLDTRKNRYNRFLDHPEMNWRVVLLSMTCRFRTIIRKNSAEEPPDSQCYIVDDTTVEKTGFHIEGLSRVFDHVRHACVPGFKLLVLAVFDGRSTFACDFSMHREKGRDGEYGLSSKERKLQTKKKRDRNNLDHDRFSELDARKNDTAVEMIKRAWNKGKRLPYALMDSWFVSEKMVAKLRKIGKEGIHLISRVKMGNQKYSVGRKKYNVHEIIALSKRKASQCRKYKCLYFEQRVMMGETYVKLIFVKMGRNATWDVLITTDTHMKFMRAFELYQIRWNIEVMFKECRQYIGFGGYQGTDFDAHIADSTLCLMTHMLLTLEKRFSQYETMGELFQKERESLLMFTLGKRILSIMENLWVAFAEHLVIDVCQTMGRIAGGHTEIEKMMSLTRLLSPDPMENDCRPAVNMH